MLDKEGGGRVPIAVTALGRAFFQARVAATQSCHRVRYTFANIPAVKNRRSSWVRIHRSATTISQKAEAFCFVFFFWQWHFLQLGEVTPYSSHFFSVPFPRGLSCLSLCFVQQARMCTYVRLSPLRNIRFLFFSRTPIGQDSFFFLAYDKSEFVAIRLLYPSFFTHFQWKYGSIAKKKARLWCHARPHSWFLLPDASPQTWLMRGGSPHYICLYARSILWHSWV